jgi:signal transduction histidine kinase/CheY-like chemotaxis protein
MTSKTLARYLMVSKIGACVALTGGLTVLGGWLFGIPRLTDFTYDGITMKANTSFALAVAGASFLLLLPEKVAAWRFAAGASLAILASLIGALTLSQHIGGWDLGIDQLLATEQPGEEATVSPGRMGPPAATSFTLIGIGLLFLRKRSQQLIVASQGLALTVGVVTLLNLVGNLYGARELHAFAPYTGISRQTALMLFIFAAGMLTARPDRGLMSVLTSNHSGGVALRRLLIPAIVLPIVFGRISAYGINARWFDVSFGIALFAVSLIVTLLGTMWWNGRALNSLSLRRLRAEQERQRLLESERHARMEVERSARLKDEFLATLSHELRTPLGAIIGWVSLLKNNARDVNTLEKGLDVIDRNARAQSELISDLLDMSRIISGKMRLAVQPVDLHEVIDAAIESVRMAADQKGVRLHTALEPVLEPVNGDPARLQQIMWNLLSNAVKFTPKGGHVKVQLRRAESYIRITVSDTGQGIAPDFQPHVFARFRQADSSMARQHGGLGLGLAIVKHLVESHGGHVDVSSAGIGRGATFSVELPAAGSLEHPTVPGGPGTLVQRSGSCGTPQLSGISALILDDERDSREMLTRLLSEYGSNVVAVATPAEAIQMLRKNEMDVFISDIGMPDINGYEMIRKLRADGIRTVAIALTAYARPEDRTLALDAGFQAHIAKPFEPADLMTTIAALVHRGATSEATQQDRYNVTP